MVNSQKWLREGAKGLSSSGSENGVAPVQHWVAPAQNRFRMVQKTLGRLLLPELKLPFAPSPNHFWGIFHFWALSQNFRIAKLYISSFALLMRTIKNCALGTQTACV